MFSFHVKITDNRFCLRHVFRRGSSFICLVVVGFVLTEQKASLFLTKMSRICSLPSLFVTLAVVACVGLCIPLQNKVRTDLFSLKLLRK